MKEFWKALVAAIKRPLKLDVYDKTYLLGGLAGYCATRILIVDAGNTPMIVFDVILLLIISGIAVLVEYRDRKKNGTLGEWS